MTVTIRTQSGKELRQLARRGDFLGQTAGQAPDYLQGNMVILPRRYAQDFLLFCTNNPKPCPLIGVSTPGNSNIPALGEDLDVRRDVPTYRVYRGGALSEEVHDISHLWSDDFVTFILGCSFSFEESLVSNGFVVRHITQGRNVPMFKTNIETVPGGVFRGPLVVSMRSFPKDQVAAVFDLSGRFPQAHGAPVFWGDPQQIGVNDIMAPDYGDAIEVPNDEVPVFWACGVTPQAAIECANPALCITHAPGCMLVTDVRSGQPSIVTPNMQALFE